VGYRPPSPGSKPLEKQAIWEDGPGTRRSLGGEAQGAEIGLLDKLFGNALGEAATKEPKPRNRPVARAQPRLFNVLHNLRADMLGQVANPTQNLRACVP
jgi:hypothetical protein